MGEFGPWEHQDNLDRWEDDTDAPGIQRCSFCGSMKPEHFLAQLRAGAEIEPTDKEYKAYVHFDTGAFPVTVTEQREGGSLTHISGGVRHLKFYYQHLSKAQRQEFIDLYNSGAMKIAYPGHFYVRPFFCVARPSDDYKEGGK